MIKKKKEKEKLTIYHRLNLYRMQLQNTYEFSKSLLLKSTHKNDLKNCDQCKSNRISICFVYIYR